MMFFILQASEREIVWVLRIAILVVGAAGTAIALTVHSVFALFVLCGDLMYVAHFPQVICALWLPFGNTYGSLTGFILGLLMRILGGEPTLGIPAVIKFPLFDEEENVQLFPYKTFSMLCSLFGIIGVSFLTDYIFKRNVIRRKFDIFKCFNDDDSKMAENDKFQIQDSDNVVENDGNKNEKSAFLADRESTM